MSKSSDRPENITQAGDEAAELQAYREKYAKDPAVLAMIEQFGVHGGRYADQLRTKEKPKAPKNVAQTRAQCETVISLPTETERKQWVEDMCVLLGSVCDVPNKGQPKKFAGAVVPTSNGKHCHVTLILASSEDKQPHHLTLAEDDSFETRDKSLPFSLPNEGVIFRIDLADANIEYCFESHRDPQRACFVQNELKLNAETQADLWGLFRDVIGGLSKNQQVAAYLDRVSY